MGITFFTFLPFCESWIRDVFYTLSAGSAGGAEVQRTSYIMTAWLFGAILQRGP